MSHILHTLRLGLMACLLLGLLPLPVLAKEGLSYVSIKGGINGGPDGNGRVGDLSGSWDSELAWRFWVPSATTSPTGFGLRPKFRGVGIL